MATTNPFDDPDTRDWLNKFGIWAVEQLPLVFPSKYLDLRQVDTVARPPKEEGEWQFLRVTLASGTKKQKMNGRPVVSFRVKDEANQLFSLEAMGGFDFLPYQAGDSIVIRCKISQRNNGLSIRSPSLVKAPEGKITAIYARDPDFRYGEILRNAMKAIPDLLERSAEFLCRTLGHDEDVVRLKSKTRFAEVADLLYHLHWPIDRNAAQMANEDARRMVGFELLERAKRHRNRQPQGGSVVPLKKDIINALMEATPFPLTADQIDAAVEICNDLHSPYPMYRLLSGDVGTGKTITFGVPAAACHLAGKQSAIVVPNETLANQMAHEFSETWPNVPVQVISKGSRIKKSDIEHKPVLIGTSALTNRLAKIKVKPDFMILDEQHKMSVEQREAVCGPHTNILESTATCIPRTAGLLLLGGMDVSVLAECPVKKVIHSRIAEHEDARPMFNFLSKIVQSGKQIAIIYPMVESSDPDVIHTFERAILEWEKHFPGKVAGVNGRMTGDEKQAVIDKMKRGEASVLISTTVIEVGITLPELQALTVVKADRFGVSQLHQLRGRVARKGGEGYFFMFCPDEISEDAHARLSLLEQHADGFTLAEQDMRQRGFGDLEYGNQDGKSLSRIFLNAKLMPDDIEAILASKIDGPSIEGNRPSVESHRTSRQPSLAAM